MTIARNAILDRQGRVIFTCSSCGEPITNDDFFDMGLRLPEDGETQDDYFSTELLDELSHTRCTREKRAG
jgi:hypothetical protein